ncbi:unnamed protein product [Dicrocoelium dendriticum]|nr:unnamed protein product [Dicrocoelium dendriticum]
MDKEHPTVDTIKMQVAFELNHVTKNEFLEEHHRVMQTRLEPVTQEAIEARGRTRDELQDVYRRIISAVLLQSGLGSPTNIEVVRETTAALQSIFPQSDLGTFLALNASQKRNQISEFTGIVIGIRLFNKDSGRGGAGIDDLPYLLAQGIPMTLNTLQDELKTAKELAAVYASLFLKICAIDPTPGSLSSSNITAAAAESMGITPELLRIAVVNARQYETFLLVLERDLIEMTANVERLCNNFNARMKELHELIRDRQSVPSMDVYPGFMELSRIWGDLQDAMVMLSALTTTLSTIQSLFVGRRLKWQREKLLGLISDSEVIYDDRIKKHGPISEAEQGNFTWIFPDPQTDISKLNIEFNGFCAWSLIKYQGLLVRPDLSLGCLFIPSENRMYAFSSAEAVQDFVLAMDRMLSALPEIMRRLPELIQFLKIGQSNSKTVSGSRDASFIEKPYGQVDAEMQTEVHPIESYIDTNYEWNEWELRKKALKLANLRRKATRSVQTILSNWRRDNATQVYLLK